MHKFHEQISMLKERIGILQDTLRKKQGELPKVLDEYAVAVTADVGVDAAKKKIEKVRKEITDTEDQISILKEALQKGSPQIKRTAQGETEVLVNRTEELNQEAEQKIREAAQARDNYMKALADIGKIKKEVSKLSSDNRTLMKFGAGDPRIGNLEHDYMMAIAHDLVVPDKMLDSLRRGTPLQEVQKLTNMQKVGGSEIAASKVE